VPRLGEILAAGLASAARLRLALPVAAELPQPLVAEAAEEHIVGSGVLGAQLEAVALELLHQHLGAAYLLQARRADGEAEHRQAAALLPIFGKAALDTVGHLAEAEPALRLSGRGGQCCQGDER